MGRPLRFELRRGADIIAHLLYYAFSVSNADRKIALMDEAQMRRALAHLVAAAVGEVNGIGIKISVSLAAVRAGEPNVRSYRLTTTMILSGSAVQVNGWDC
jgi:hypothetical protein